MPKDNVEVAIVGGGAAGIAAGRRLREAQIDCLLIEARPRLGGRAYTVVDASGFALDLGCGWLHSADRNPWAQVAEGEGFTIDKTPPPWSKPSLPVSFPLAEQQSYREAFHAFYERLGPISRRDPDVAAASAFDPGGRWNALINAIGTYISGAELEQVSARDYENYEDTNVNWRVFEGYGAAIAAYGEPLPSVLDCPVHRIDHSGKRLRVETANGAISADQAIVTLPSAVIAANERLFSPVLPEKTESASDLPLGLADKLFLSLEGAEEFEADSHLIGNPNSTQAAIYQFRPFGRPQIEAYFGGHFARELEAGGARAFFDFAVSELAAVFGSNFAKRLSLHHMHCWGSDPFARGSYSYAVPGKADCRARLAAPVEDRLFFAGEACSRHDFSTAHGGYLTGIAAAEQVIAARGRTTEN